MFNIWHIAYKMTAIAKKEILYVFPFGLSAYLAGVVFINRSNAKNAYKQLQVTSEVMVKQKVDTAFIYSIGNTLSLYIHIFHKFKLIYTAGPLP